MWEPSNQATSQSTTPWGTLPESSSMTTQNIGNDHPLVQKLQPSTRECRAPVSGWTLPALVSRTLTLTEERVSTASDSCGRDSASSSSDEGSCGQDVSDSRAVVALFNLDLAAAMLDDSDYSDDEAVLEVLKSDYRWTRSGDQSRMASSHRGEPVKA